MKSQAIRQSFLDFFTRHGHRVVASAPLVPRGDATLMFTNAGMVPFKDFFLGLDSPEDKRAVSAQKCLRVSGKHNDLENVGPSPRHHTFFEMLGNFSFGDYFKAEAIEFAWGLVTEVWELDPATLFATVFEQDDEAWRLWRKISGLPEARILRCGAKDNFWSMGDTGPCGPCSEIFVDRQPQHPGVPWEEGSETGRYLEIWNLVFMQLERFEDGSKQPLARPSIDTGAGLERLAAVLQGVASNYDSDLFQPILAAAAERAGRRYGQDANADVSLRVIADHLRAVSFLLADGVIPSSDGRGYVLRRLLRRAVRHGLRLGFEEPFLHRLVPVLEGVLGQDYQELGATRQATETTVLAEEEKYLQTRATGARHIQAAIDRARAAGERTLGGAALFDLYETYGQELDSVREIAEEEGLAVDAEGFAAERDRHRAQARVVTESLQKKKASLRQALARGGELGETAFEGYDALRLEGVAICRLARESAAGAEAADALDAGERGVVVLDRTVFYAESGGQVGDRGWIRAAGGARVRVLDTQKDTVGTIFHQVEVESGRLAQDESVTLEVDAARRKAIERNHSATHLLHAALRKELGDGVRQAGSWVAPERLRFDFTHGRPLTPQSLEAVEDRVNAEIRRATATVITSRGREEALALGAIALFGEKYGDRVRTVEIPGVSLELCGGCHVRSTGEIALLLITGERGSASGVRRIEAVTGEAALALVRARSACLAEVAAALSSVPERAAAGAVALKQRVRQLEKELATLRMKLLAGEVSAAKSEPQDIGGIMVLARAVPAAPIAELRSMADRLRDQLGSGLVVLASRTGADKASLIVTVSKDLVCRVRAGDLVQRLAPIIDGRGGGRPDFAQAGGKAPEKITELLAAVPEAVRVLAR